MGTSSSYVSYVKDLFVLGLVARSAGRGVHTLGEARSEVRVGVCRWYARRRARTPRRWRPANRITGAHVASLRTRYPCFTS